MQMTSIRFGADLCNIGDQRGDKGFVQLYIRTGQEILRKKNYRNLNVFFSKGYYIVVKKDSTKQMCTLCIAETIYFHLNQPHLSFLTN